MLNWTFLKRALQLGAVCAMLGMLVPTLAAAQPAAQLAPYQTIAKDALKLVAAGDTKGATKLMLDMEAKWDASGLEEKFPDLDDQMDTMRTAVASGNAKNATTELNKYLQMIDDYSKR